MRGIRTIHLNLFWICVAALAVAGSNADAQQTSPGSSSTLLSAPAGAGARALAMGGAFIAVADDATAASWNPAGLAAVQRPQVTVVGDVTRLADSLPSYTLIRSYPTGLRATESGPGVGATRRSRNVDFASVTYPVTVGRSHIVPQFSYRRAVKGNFAEQRTQPYEYTDSTGFRETGSDAVTFEPSQGIDVYSGGVGVTVARMLHIGAVLNLWRGGPSGEDSRRISGSFSLPTATGSLTPSSYRSTYTETFTGTNVDVGVLFKPISRVSLGAVVHNKFNLTREYSYARQYTNWGGSISSQEYGENGAIEWPRSIGVGVAVRPASGLTVSTDYTRSSWSEATYIFTASDTQVINGRRTTIDTAGDAIYPTLFRPSAPVQQHFNVPQRDSSQLRMGGEFMWRRADTGLFAAIPIRAGVYRNRSLLPQSNGDERSGIGATIGTGVTWRQFSVDVAYSRESISGKSSEFPLTVLNGFSESQKQDGVEITVLHRLMFSTTVTF